MCVHTHARTLCTYMCAHEMDRGRKTGYAVTVSAKSFEINGLGAKPGRLQGGFGGRRRLRGGNRQAVEMDSGGLEARRRRRQGQGCRAAEKSRQAGRQGARQAFGGGASQSAQAARAPRLAATVWGGPVRVGAGKTLR